MAKPRAKIDGKEMELVKERDSVISPQLGDKFLSTFFKTKNKVECRTWVLDGIETTVDKAEVKLGSEQVEIRGKLYNIDYTAIQNQFGKLVYNIRHNDATGALRYIKPKLSTNAKNAREMLQRNWLTALWSSWKLPLLVAFIAIGAAVLLGMIALVMFQDGQAKQKNIDRLTQDNFQLKSFIFNMTNTGQLPNNPNNPATGGNPPNNPNTPRTGGLK